jgi:hypothetical protein
MIGLFLSPVSGFERMGRKRWFTWAKLSGFSIIQGLLSNLATARLCEKIAAWPIARVQTSRTAFIP